MLQSEFYERTGVTLSAEEYAKVERIYDNVKMDKDHFCEEWKKIRTNTLFNEIMDAFEAMEKENFSLNDKVSSLESRYESDIEKERKQAHDKLESLAMRLIPSIDDDTRIYDILEEEFTLDFIIKVKLQENMDLELHERQHLIKML